MSEKPLISADDELAVIADKMRSADLTTCLHLFTDSNKTYEQNKETLFIRLDEAEERHSQIIQACAEYRAHQKKTRPNGGSNDQDTSPAD